MNGSLSYGTRTVGALRLRRHSVDPIVRSDPLSEWDPKEETSGDRAYAFIGSAECRTADEQGSANGMAGTVRRRIWEEVCMDWSIVGLLAAAAVVIFFVVTRKGGS